jgi:hypothetical protein
MPQLPLLFYIIILTPERGKNTSEFYFRFIWKNQTKTFNSSAELRKRAGPPLFCSLNVKETGKKSLC